MLGFVAGLTQCLSKLALDSVIQRDVPERVRTSAFARSDTTLQLAWVLGGFVGIAMPLAAPARDVGRGRGDAGLGGVRARRAGASYDGAGGGAAA